MTVSHPTLLCGWLYNQITAQRDEGSWGEGGISLPRDPLGHSNNGSWSLVIFTEGIRRAPISH